MLGEIYVIAVDPDFQGLGLGNQLTLAGLASIAGRGVTVGMLYVDDGNTAAVTMYERLGFTVHRTDRAFTRPTWRRHRLLGAALRRRPGRARRAARRRAALPGRPGVGRASTAPGDAGRDDGPARRCAPRSPTALPAALEPVTESVSDGGDTVKLLWALDGGARVETVLMLLPGPGDRVRLEPGRLRDGLRLLRHRPGRLHAPPPRARSSSRSCGRPAGPATAGAASATSCSWGWASRSPTTPRSGAPSSGCTATSACRPATSRSRRSASCPASAGSPSAACR